MGKIQLLIANASGYFSETEGVRIRTAAGAADAYITDAYPFDYSVDVVVAPPSYLMSTIPEDGIGGRTFSSRLIMLTVDKQQADISEDVIFETICHEMAHSLRWEKLPEYSKTLFDSIIFEGLAIAVEETALQDMGREHQQFFLREMQGTSKAEIHTMINALGSSLDSEDYEYDAIFFTGNDVLSRWAGYRLGYYFVKTIMQEANIPIDQLVVASYEELRKLAVGIISNTLK